MYKLQDNKMSGVRNIVEWLDNRNCSLYQCFNNPKYYGYNNQQEFLNALNSCTEVLSNSSEGWQGKSGNINISRCLKGLKGLDAKTIEVRKLLTVLTDKIQNSKAALDAQAIGNGLYGLQNMDATVQEVAQLINALEEKKPHYNQLVQNDWARNQLVSSYIALSNTFNNKQHEEDFLKQKGQYIFSKINDESSNVKDRFYQELVNKYVKDDVLDLHGLDHLTAKYLLKNLHDHSGHSIKVIFGKASHNVTSHNFMKVIVDEWIKEHNLRYHEINEGCYNVEQLEESTLLTGDIVD